VLAHVSDYYEEETGAKQPSTLLSRILTVVEVVVLVIAIIMLAINAPNILARFQTTATPSPIPTLTPAPTETLNPSAFDMSAATPVVGVNKVIEIMVPSGWTVSPDSQAQSEPGFYQYSITYGSGTNSARLQILIGKPQLLYGQVLNLTASFETPQAALEAFKKSVPADSQVVLKDVHAVKVGKLDGQGLAFTVPGSAQQGPDSEIEVWIAPLSNGEMALLILQGTKPLWDKSQPILYKMIDGLVINVQNIPTETPTPTLHPLNMTQTAIQQTIVALTPSNTPTPAATAAATGAATGVATGAATTVPTTAPTTVPTIAATAAATSTMAVVETAAATVAPTIAPTEAATATAMPTSTATPLPPTPTATVTATATTAATAAATAP
jgi:hypothetical protein